METSGQAKPLGIGRGRRRLPLPWKSPKMLPKEERALTEEDKQDVERVDKEGCLWDDWDLPDLLPPKPPVPVAASVVVAPEEPKFLPPFNNNKYFYLIETSAPQRKITLADIRPTLRTVIICAVRNLRGQPRPTSEVIPYHTLKKEDCNQVVDIISREFGRDLGAIVGQDREKAQNRSDKDCGYVIILFRKGKDWKEIN